MAGLLLRLLGTLGGLVGFGGARLQAQAVVFAAGLLNLCIQQARAGGVAGNLGALLGQISQVFGLGLIAITAPDLLGLGQRVTRVFQFNLGILAHSGVGTGALNAAAGLLQRRQRRVGGASAHQAGGKQGGG